MEAKEVYSIMEKIFSSPEAEELLKEAKPETEEKEIEAYLKLAEKMGYRLTADDLKEAAKIREEEVRASSELAAQGYTKIAADSLENNSGGAESDEPNQKCAYTYKDWENCWISDGCDHFLQEYSYYRCKRMQHGCNGGPT